MSGDTWVALDGRAAGAYTGTCWISDVGPYTGPDPAVMFTDTTLVPVDAKEVDYLIVLPNPDGRDDHVLDSSYTTADYQQWYLLDGEMSEVGDAASLDSGAHLFVVWYAPGVAGNADPATLPTPSRSPLDLAPRGWVSGGRLDVFVVDPDVPVIGLCDEDGVLLRYLPTATGITWQHELSAPGALSCRLPLDDPTTAEASPKRILKAFWRGAARMAARIDSSSVDVAVDGRGWREFNNLPGMLNMLGDAIIYPETGLLDASQQSRTFGYMSKPGYWYNPADWSAPIGVAWVDENDVKAGKPEGLDYPNPKWIALNGPHNPEPTGSVQYFRKSFSTSAAATKYQILATADNNLTLWLDGEQLISPDQQQGLTWRYLVQVTGTLSAGTHQLAAKISNDPPRTPGSYNPMSLILTLQRLQANGDVVVETPLVNSDESWKVTAAQVGFRRGDILATLFEEAHGRGVKAMQVLGLGFTHTADSSGAPWTDTPGEYAFDALTSALDAVQVLAEKDIDVDVDFDTLTVTAHNRKGTDKSATVTLQLGKDGGAIMSHRVDRVEARFNTALIQKADGTYQEVQDAASVTTYGRIETGLQLGSTAETDTAQEVAAGAFADNADTTYTFTTQISSLAGPQLYVDFDLGDSISVPDDEDGTAKVRLMAATVDASGEVPVITPEFAVDRSA